MKTKTVTLQDLQNVSNILQNHKKDVQDYLQGIAEAEVYLKQHVEDQGLYEFSTKILGGGVTCSQAENMLACKMFEEFNSKLVGSTEHHD